ncbi:GTP_cyclohydroI domain-containing protein [Haematococcus lacustris]|uniref:GTP cyclohydrolase 1 n=1 Tax=Haematococcus lacustris TaxID=44745 RepID=A0A699YPU5_HAELA|nr:GTP_cyclohydroI domain-containing protein [Haematococcus lacustris]
MAKWICVSKHHSSHSAVVQRCGQGPWAPLTRASHTQSAAALDSKDQLLHAEAAVYAQIGPAVLQAFADTAHPLHLQGSAARGLDPAVMSPQQTCQALNGAGLCADASALSRRGHHAGRTSGHSQASSQSAAGYRFWIPSNSPWVRKDGTVRRVLGTALFHEPCVYQGGGGIVLVREIDFASTSTTTLLPFHGQVHIAYVPFGGVVLGLSKLVRLTKLFAKRLQTQQGLGQDIAIALAKQLKSCGAAVVISARHLTLLAAEPPGLHTTVCVDGSFAEKPELLQEALCLLGLDIQALTPDQIHSTAAAAPPLQPELAQEHDSEAGALSAEALQGPSTPDCSEKDSERDCMLSEKGCESEKEADTEPQGLCHVSRRELSAVFRSTSGFDLSLDSRCASPAVPSSTCSTCCGIPACPLLLPTCGCGCPPEVQFTTACNLASMQLPGGSCECAAADRRAAMRTAVMVMLKEALGSSLPSTCPARLQPMWTPCCMPPRATASPCPWACQQTCCSACTQSRALRNLPVLWPVQPAPV